MRSKSTFVFFVVVFLASCASPVPSETAVQVSLTPTIQTATPESPTNTPAFIPTETKPASPTAEVVLNGLIIDLDEIPTITAAEEQLRIQKAIETASVPAPVGGDSFDEIQISQFEYFDGLYGKAVRIGSNPSESFMVRDTYQVMLETDEGVLPIRKVLFELYVTFEDGTQGSVILAVVYDEDFTQAYNEKDEDTQFRLQMVLEKMQKKTIGMRFLVELEERSRDPNNPVIITLLEQLSEDEEAQALLQKAYQLAKDGKFLSQDEINRLGNFIIFL